MNPPSSDSALRTVAGRYQLREVLGRGGMGTVWLAEDLLLRREVALKELLFPDTLEAEQQDELRQRSLREAQAAARISSPHAVKVYDVVTDGGRPWIVMERHHGRTLSEIIRADGPRSPAETARIGLAILSALENAHAAGIVHRDVKPSNVLVRSDGHVTLTDFGIARGIQDTTITRTGMIVGSPAYVAPERATGAPALPPSDLWALGATLFTTVEGHPPYDRGDPMQTLAAVMYGEPEPCRAAGPLAPVIGALLAKNPADRPTIPAARNLLTAVASSTAAGTATLPMDGGVRMGDRTVLLPSGPGAEAAAVRGTPLPPTTVPPTTPPQTTPPPATLPPVLAATRQRPPIRSAPSSAPPRGQRRLGTRSGIVLIVIAVLAAATALFAATRPQDPGGDTLQGRTGPSTPAGSTSPRAAVSGGVAAGAGEPATGAASPRTSTSGSASPSASDDKTDEKAEDDTKNTDGRDEGSGGQVRYTDAKVGWSIDKPGQWRVRQRGGLTDLIDPATGGYLRIDSTDKPKPSAVGAWQEYEPGFAGRHPGYARIGMETIRWRDFEDVADWEYTYGQGAGRFHAINRGIVTGGRGYALNFQTRASQWEGSRGLMKQLFESFRPAGT